MFSKWKTTGCPAFVTTTNDEGLPYNDGQWHTIKAVRLGKSGRLWLDTTWKGLMFTWYYQHAESVLLYLTLKLYFKINEMP